MSVEPVQTVTQDASPIAVWIGSMLIVLALTLIAVLLAWSRRTIERIAERRLSSAREIARDRETDVRT